MTFKSNMSKEEIAQKKTEAEKGWAERVAKFKSDAPAVDVARFNNTPMRYQKRWLAAYDGTISRPGALRLKCFECVAYEDVQETIGNCKARTCPLWHFRPIKPK